MNNKLTSKPSAGREVPLGPDILGFDKNGHCRGIVRTVGEMPFETPKPITRAILELAKQQPAVFTVDDPKTPTNEAQPFAAVLGGAKKPKKAKAAAAEVKTEPVEVEGTKGVIDVPVSDPVESDSAE